MKKNTFLNLSLVNILIQWLFEHRFNHPIFTNYNNSVAIVYLKNEKDYNPNHNYHLSSILLLSLRFNLVDPLSIIILIKIIVYSLFWMSIFAGGVILLDSFLNLPDEISGVLYFVGIGIVVSSVLNLNRNF